jgi:hypothetical protein
MDKIAAARATAAHRLSTVTGENGFTTTLFSHGKRGKMKASRGGKAAPGFARKAGLLQHRLALPWASPEERRLLRGHRKAERRLRALRGSCSYWQPG